MTRVLVLGRSGQVAMSLADQAKGHANLQMRFLGRSELDLEHQDHVTERILSEPADLIINAAAYTAVDKAESEPDRAFAINRDGAAAAAEAAWRLGVPFVHISTDYVFDGLKATPYVETDAIGPLNVYGHSKLAGEQAVLNRHPKALVLRTSWVFSPFGGNFVKTMLKLGTERPQLKIVADQLGNPTSAIDLAGAILRIAPGLGTDPGGLYHLSGTGSTNWYEFARTIFAEGRKYGGPNPDLEPIPSSAYKTPAARPANSRLDCNAFETRFGFALRPWSEAVAETVAALQST